MRFNRHKSSEKRGGIGRAEVRRLDTAARRAHGLVDLLELGQPRRLDGRRPVVGAGQPKRARRDGGADLDVACQPWAVLSVRRSSSY